MPPRNAINTVKPCKVSFKWFAFPIATQISLLEEWRNPKTTNEDKMLCARKQEGIWNEWNKNEMQTEIDFLPFSNVCWNQSLLNVEKFMFFFSPLLRLLIQSSILEFQRIDWRRLSSDNLSPNVNLIEVICRFPDGHSLHNWSCPWVLIVIQQHIIIDDIFLQSYRIFVGQPRGRSGTRCRPWKFHFISWISIRFHYVQVRAE